MDACGMCGGELDDLAVCVTLTFAPGRRGPRTYAEVPWRLDDWWVCWACLSAEKGLALRTALVDEYMEPVISRPPTRCRAVCSGGHARRRLRSVFSLRQGSRGEPAGSDIGWARCPVCYGRADVERVQWTPEQQNWQQ